MLEIPKCPRCGKSNYYKKGHYHGVQSFVCRNCGRKFQESYKVHPHGQTPPNKVKGHRNSRAPKAPRERTEIIRDIINVPEKVEVPRKKVDVSSIYDVPCFRSCDKNHCNPVQCEKLDNYLKIYDKELINVEIQES